MIKFCCHIALVLMLFSSTTSFAQGQPQGKIDRQQTFEEEIIRYLGYEEVPVRYISLPYDATMSHNVTLNFMDIGFLLLMFVPLIFLWRAQGKMRIILGLLMMIMCVFSIGSSHVLSADGGKLDSYSDNIDAFVQQMDGQPIYKAVVEIYRFCGAIYQPIGKFIASLTDDGSDHITYLILLAILYALYFTYSKFSTKKSADYLLGALILFYCFFMLILSAGIIWYGFLMFPLLYLEVARYSDVSPFYKKLFLGAGVVFVIMAYFLKVSNLNFINEQGIGMIQPPVLAYNFSDVSQNEFYEGYYANIGPALDKINANEDGLIFQAGTSISFLIKKNNDRVFKDGILNIFNQMVDKYKGKTLVTEALKASGFKYIIVSPTIVHVDQTPEKSLTRKFSRLLGYLDNNRHINLLATNRLVRVRDENGRAIEKYDFLYTSDVEVIQEGSYAIFEIR